MKFIVVLALAGLAMAEPEAKADPYYPYSPFGSHGYYLPSYLPSASALGPYHGYSYGKRDAEAEAEADPQLLINNFGLHPSTYGGVYNTLPVHSVNPLVYNTALKTPVVGTVYNTALKTPVVGTVYNTALKTPVVGTVYNTALKTPVVGTVYNTALKTPVVGTVYNTALKTPVVGTVYNTALHTPTLLNAFPTLKTLTTPVVSSINKREAEADPALVYTNTLPLATGLHHPYLYNSVVPKVHTPLVPKVYTTAVQTPLVKTLDNAVVPTLGGYIHSSHVGVCTNNLGVQVPC